MEEKIRKLILCREKRSTNDIKLISNIKLYKTNLYWSNGMKSIESMKNIHPNVERFWNIRKSCWNCSIVQKLIKHHLSLAFLFFFRWRDQFMFCIFCSLFLLRVFICFIRYNENFRTSKSRLFWRAVKTMLTIFSLFL